MRPAPEAQGTMPGVFPGDEQLGTSESEEYPEQGVWERGEDTMTHDELQTAIAAALGWVETSDAGVYRDRSTSLIVGALPHWTRSLDACARDLLPVARERGWCWTHTGGYGEKETWRFYAPVGDDAVGLAPTGEIALALCEAWLAGPGKGGGGMSAELGLGAVA